MNEISWQPKNRKIELKNPFVATKATESRIDYSYLRPNRDRCSLILLSTSDFTKSYYFQNRSFDATAATTGRAFDAAATTNGATAARTGGAAASATTAASSSASRS
jgi:hypothetical protein